jgi:hypothetical protein
VKEEILKRIDALADKLGVAASYIFKLYVQQARVEVLHDFAVLIVSGVITWVSIKAMQYFFADSDSDARIPFVICGFLGTIVAAIMLIDFMFSDVWTAMMNPEFWAFHHIVRDIKSGQ